MLNAKNGQIPWADGNLWVPAIQEVKTGKGKYKYYLYYSANPKAGIHREVCIDRMEFNADGTIKPVQLCIE